MSDVEYKLSQLTDMLFNKSPQWHTVPDEFKVKNSFIINRFLSQKYPQVAQAFNKKGIDQVAVLEFWFSYLPREYKTPLWMWKGTPKKKEKVSEQEELENWLNSLK